MRERERERCWNGGKDGVLGMEKIEEDKETLKLRMKKMEKEEIFL